MYALTVNCDERKKIMLFTTIEVNLSGNMGYTLIYLPFYIEPALLRYYFCNSNIGHMINFSKAKAHKPLWICPDPERLGPVLRGKTG